MIYERMKEIREYCDNTQLEMATMLGVSRSTYAGWENGLDTIPLLKLNDFCNYYKISLDYICGLTSIKKCLIINDKIDTIIVDPARAGLDKKTIEVINNICPQRIIYVSCDTQSLANNLVDLTNYEIKKFYILDMFSYTYHIECFCILDRK